MSHPETAYKKVTTHTIQKMKIAGEKISMITAYDYSFAKIFDAAGIDIILVGEIRDKETAKIAVESGLTGQLVFSSLHAIQTRCIKQVKQIGSEK